VRQRDEHRRVDRIGLAQRIPHRSQLPLERLLEERSGRLR
jgi:hypothetical protein